MTRLAPLVWIGYIGMGVVQWIAVYSFFRQYWDWHWLFAFPAAMFAAYTPLLGSVCGMVAAIKIWYWEWWQAGLLFFWWPVLYCFLTGGFHLIAWVQERFRS